MIKLGIAGVCGKMGNRIFSLARNNKDFEITLALERKGIPEIGKELGRI
jgi:dihydrodipicolinate reductase